MSKTIEITVSPQGKTRLETKGFAGEACREASEFLERTLGQTQAETLTVEFHQCQEKHGQEISHANQQRSSRT